MNHRCAPGRIPGRYVAGFVTFLVGLCLAASTVAMAPARAAIGPIRPEDPSVTVPTDGGEFRTVQRLGTRSEAQRFVVQNRGMVPITMGEVTLEAADYQYGYSADPETGRKAFSATSDCPGAILLPAARCEVAVTFAPLRPGSSAAALRVTHDGASGAFVLGLRGSGDVGVYVAGAFGEVLNYGGAKPHGDLSHVAIQSPVLGIATTPSGEGYWLMEARGEMHAFGDATDLGSPALPPGEYAISLAATRTGKGYWLATQAGGVYAVGDAESFGSAAGTLGPDVNIAGIAASPTGKGYWLLDSAGGVRAYGDANFFGSAASLPPRYPVNGIAGTGTGKGYWLVDAAGGVFAYGDAPAFKPETPLFLYSEENLAQDGVISVETAPWGQGFAFLRMRGGIGAEGVTLPMESHRYGYGNGFHDGSVAVDLAFNAAPVQPSPEAGTVTRTAEPGLRTPEKVCVAVPCIYPPAQPPNSPPVAPPALPDANGPFMPEPVWRPEN